MTPRIQFEKNEIIEAALEIAKNEGFGGITARKVAKELGCSVAPIYVNFENIEDLIDAVVQRVYSLSGQFIHEAEGKDYFEKVGRASLSFARDYPVLLRELIFKPNPYKLKYDETEQVILEGMRLDPLMKDLKENDRRMLLLKMQIFQVGLSVMIANDNMPSWLHSEEYENLLIETGEELMCTVINKKENEKK